MRSEQRTQLAAKLRKRYEQGAAIRTISHERRIPYSSVRNLLVESGVTLRGKNGCDRGRVPKYAQLADELRSAIEAGEIKPGDRIRIDLIIAEYGVSETTARRAIIVLRNAGLVIGRSRTVAAPDRN